ncbi:MAG TPA: ribosome silencing factor [Phycisphaerae bacterium]|nr:ribosome silencing factor [Phycisphaerae bacterium]
MAKRQMTARRLAIAMARVCAENRCREVAVLDLRKLSPVTDFFVLATGTSARQMRAVAEWAVRTGRDLGEKPFGVEGADPAEGADASRWLLVDYVDVVVHVFTDESRRYYDLELLWGDAPRVDWQRGWKPRPDGEAAPAFGDA